MTLFLRKFCEGDLGKIIEIEKASFPDPWSRNGFLYHYRTNPQGFIVAEDGGEVVGYAVARIEATFELRNLSIYRRCHLANLAVEPKKRKMGMGTKLLEEILRYARRKGAKEVYLEVRTKNASARRFYEKKGFIEKGFKKRYYSDDDAVIMALTI